MTKQEFLSCCLTTYGTSPDYPFDEDFETAVPGTQITESGMRL